MSDYEQSSQSYKDSIQDEDSEFSCNGSQQQGDIENQQFSSSFELQISQTKDLGQSEEQSECIQSHQQQKKQTSYLQLALKQQLNSNTEKDYQLCHKVGQKLLQIVFIKIVNVYLQDKNIIHKIQVAKLQQIIVCSFLQKKQDIRKCIQQHRLIKQIGRLFLTNNYEQLQYLQKQLCNLIKGNQQLYQQHLNNKFTLQSLQKQQQQKLYIAKVSDTSISLTNSTHKNEPKYFQSLIDTPQVNQKPQLFIIDKAILSTPVQKVETLQQQVNKFTQFLQQPKSKTRKRKAYCENNHPKRFKNFKKNRNQDNYKKYQQKWPTKQHNKQVCTHGTNCYYTQKNNLRQQNKHNHQQKQKLYNRNQHYAHHNYYPNTDYNSKWTQNYPQTNTNITMTMLDQSLFPQNLINHQISMQFQYAQVENLTKPKIEDRINSVGVEEFAHGITQIQNKEKNNQDNQSLVYLLKQLEIIDQEKHSKGVQAQTNFPFTEVPAAQNQEHKKRIEQYLKKVNCYRNQLNILCQHFGLNQPVFEREIDGKEFLIESRLQFQSLYLNKKKIKILTDGKDKNTKKATQIACRKILRIIYQNIEQMWKDFVYVKQKKGLKT